MHVVVAKIVFAVSSLHVARTIIIYYPCSVAIQHLCHVLSGVVGNNTICCGDTWTLDEICVYTCICVTNPCG